MDMKVGYSRVKITPEHPIPISGYGDEPVRISQGVKDDLYATCIAITQKDDTILLFALDVLGISDWFAGQIRQAVCPATGIPEDRVFFCGSHTHSGPIQYGDDESAVDFREKLWVRARQAAEEAMADRVPAQMLSTVFEVPDMNFIRHYETEDGTYVGSNFGNWSLRRIRHATETDPRMILVKFAREGKTDVVMMNWQGHNDNCKEVGYYLISSSYVGRVRNAFERDNDVLFAFFMGASGNQNIRSKLDGENPGMAYEAYGEKLAEIAAEKLADLKPVTGEGIKVTHYTFVADRNKACAEMLEQAKEVWNTWCNVGKDESRALAEEYGFTSPYQAGSIISRAEMPDTVNIELDAFRIGDMGFFVCGNEVFSTIGRYVRANAPFENVFIITGNFRYLPSRESYDYRAYEADTSIYAQGTAEKVSEKLVEMLHEVK